MTLYRTLTTVTLAGVLGSTQGCANTQPVVDEPVKDSSSSNTYASNSLRSPIFHFPMPDPEAADDSTTNDIDSHPAATPDATAQNQVAQSATAPEAEPSSEKAVPPQGASPFSVYFDTGKDTLTELDEQKIATVAEQLKQNPSWTISVTGHADPRGTDEYNNVLAQERAKAVAEALVELGIEAKRIESRGHGSDRSLATRGDKEAYRRDRRVDVKLVVPQSESNLAQNQH